MSDAKYTPGPWVVSDERVGFADFIEGPRGTVCQMFNRQDEDFDEKPVKLANARLIAAAPELLAALTELADRGEAYMKYHAGKFYDGHDRPIGITPFIEAARIVIARAEGR